MNIIELSKIMASCKNTLISQMEMSLCKQVQAKWRGGGTITVLYGNIFVYSCKVTLMMY